MISWPVFALAFAGFFATHTIPVRPRAKAALQRRLGVRGFTLAYSVLSLVMLGVVISAAAHAPYVQLWPQADWHYYVVAVGMFTVCVLLALSIGRPNPFSFGGQNNAAFDPVNPGIVRLSRHPLLVALALWAGLHLLPNGDVAHVIMFGVFLTFALLGRKIIDRRNRRLMGAERWSALLREVQATPLALRIHDEPGTWIRFALGVLAYILLILLHPVILGVTALPYLIW